MRNKSKRGGLSLPITTRGSVTLQPVDLDPVTYQEIGKGFIALDTETTGLDANQCRIIEIGCVRFTNLQPTNRFGTLVDAGVPVPPEASRINHITNAMLIKAPTEEAVFKNLTRFLGDALSGGTVVCAHNASFDMGFLSETLMRLGYSGNIRYLDTLSLSRRYVGGVKNYKQTTLERHFGLRNPNAHRAESDALICGQILTKILPLAEKQNRNTPRALVIEKKPLSDIEKSVCAYIQVGLANRGCDPSRLTYRKHSAGYVSVQSVYEVLRFKIAKKGNYAILSSVDIANLNLDTEPCTVTEGGTDNTRVFFETPYELMPVMPIIARRYKEDGIRATKDAELLGSPYIDAIRRENMIYGHEAFSNNEATAILERTGEWAQGHAGEERKHKPQKDQHKATRDEIKIIAENSRRPLPRQVHLPRWEEEAALIDKFIYYDEMRKSGDYQAAIRGYDKLREAGYFVPALYTSYAMAYDKLKDYSNEILILEEAIRLGLEAGKMEARRDKAIQRLYKVQHPASGNKKQDGGENTDGAAPIAKSDKVNTAKKASASTKRAVIQMDDEMNVLHKYESVANAANTVGISTKSIRDAANGKQKHAAGFVWKYEDQGD